LLLATVTVELEENDYLSNLIECDRCLILSKIFQIQDLSGCKISGPKGHQEMNLFATILVTGMPAMETVDYGTPL